MIMRLSLLQQLSSPSMSGPAARHTGQAHVKPSVCSFSWENANNANDLVAVSLLPQLPWFANICIEEAQFIS